MLPDGEVLWTGNKCVKDVAGYSLRNQFIGSEGTLGVITKVLLRLIPRPAAKKILLAGFSQMDQNAQTSPCSLEVLNRTTIACVDDYVQIGLPHDHQALPLMQTGGPPRWLKRRRPAGSKPPVATAAASCARSKITRKAPAWLPASGSTA